MRKKVIEIDSLSYTYPDGRPALEGVSLEVFEGETVGILGANGAGKTTLLLHLNGIAALSPRVRVLGREVNRKNLREIRSRVGLVFQNPDDQLFSPTVFDDVAFGPANLGLSREEVKARVEQALRQMGVDGYEHKIPHHLSSGEKKRISIATVLSLPCELLVLDEPTSSLDPWARRNLLALLKALPQTKIIAGHDLEAVREVCDRVLFMERGRIAADGAPSALLDGLSPQGPARFSSGETLPPPGGKGRAHA